MRGLVDADVGFDAAEEDLAGAGRFETREKCRRAARAEGHLFDCFERRRQNRADLIRGVPEPFRILFRNDNGHAQELRGVCHQSDARRGLRKVGDVRTKSILHVSDDERRARRIERVWVLHTKSLGEAVQPNDA